jgi:hypothetical protein
MSISALRQLDLATLRAIWWTARTLRNLRRRLPEEGLDARVPPPPPVPDHAIRGVSGLLAKVARASCLERALILQSWLASHGRPYTIAVGVAVDGGFAAHAWLEGYDRTDGRYELLTRVPADAL